MSAKICFFPVGSGDMTLIQTEDDKNILIVKDNGIGISENANDSLGMSLIKSLVEMNLNGVLKIENNNGTLVQIEWEE